MKYRNQKQILRASIAAAIAMTMASGVFADEKKYELDIKQQQVGLALVELGTIAGVQMMVPQNIGTNVRFAGLKGEYELAEALTEILSGSGLVYEFASSDEVVIKEANQMKKEREKINKGEIEEVTITGSRISRTNFDTPTPVQLLDRDAIEGSGFNSVGDIMQRVPALGLGQGPANAGFGTDGGAVFLDLRGMGTDRTLTLVNGRRRVSGSSLTSAVDLSTIPAAMIEGIEVITGGASAVYGADAVTGVVNVKLRREFDGLEVSGRTGISQEGDTESNTFSIATGGDFSGGKGHFGVGLTYTRDEPLYFADREHANRSIWFLPNPDNTGPNDGIPDNITVLDPRIPATHPAGTFIIGGTRYTVDPGLRPTQNDIDLGFYGSGGDGYNNGLAGYLRAGGQTTGGIMTLDYEITDKINFYSDINFSNAKTSAATEPTFDYGLSILRDNPFIPADVAALMDSNGLTSLIVNRTNVDQGKVTNSNSRDTYTIVSGLKGELGDDMHWDLFYQYGYFKNLKRQQNTRIMDRFYNALDAIIDPETGDPVCRDANARSEGCVPLNIFGLNAATPEALAWFQHERLSEIKNTQMIVGFNLAGNAFDLPAGPVSFAVGAEYRKEALSARDDGLAVTGKLDPIFSSGFEPIDAEFDVSEVYAETLVPLLSDLPFIKEFNMEGALRFSDYSTIDSTTAWKVGGNWVPVEGIRFRGTRSRSVRAPNINEFFNPGGIIATGGGDPCDSIYINDNANRIANCKALGIPEGWEDPDRAFGGWLSLTGGNPNLEEETSDSWTVGTVLEPSFVPGLRISLDYWNISIDGAINAIPIQQIVDKCVDSDTLDNAFCPLITREADLTILTIDSREINIGEMTAKGVDFQLGYTFGLDAFFGGAPGEVDLSLVGTRLLENEELVDKTDPSTLLVEDGEPDNPHWRANFTIGYRLDALRANWIMRYVGSSLVDVQRSAEFYDRPNVPGRTYHDFFASYSPAENYDLTLGINNIFDTKPPRHAAVHSGTFGSALYDSIGRYFFVGAKVRF